MKVGVLGCNGFLGRYFLEYNKWIPITREEVDLLNPVSVEKFFHRYKFSVIIHCAVVGGSRLKEDSSDVLKENILMFENVVRVFKGKLIYFSSGAALRGNPPTDPYGLSKWIIDSHFVRTTFGNRNLKMAQCCFHRVQVVQMLWILKEAAERDHLQLMKRP